MDFKFKFSDYTPALITSLKTYNRAKFVNDLMSGIIVGVVALPLAIAFGIASGVSPQQGIITAIIGGFIVSLLGGSNVQIGGPTGAFIIIISGIIGTYGIEGLAIATLMAGVMLVLMGVFKLGRVIRFIPYPIIIGFTAGIAVIIFTSQVKDFLGLQIENDPSNFFSKWGVYIQHFSQTNLLALGIGLATLAIIIVTPMINKKIPGSLIAIIVVTVVCYIMRNMFGIEGIETIGDRYVISNEIPSPTGFSLNMDTITALMSPAISIAILGAIESLLSATVADGVTGDRHNSNTELIAQGAANIISPIFGGIPVTGAIARTMTNINNGGKTPISGIIHAVVLLLILLILAPLAVHIPMSCLAGILIIVAYNMSGWRTIRSMSKNKTIELTVLWITLLLTVIFNLNVAIEVGMLLAVILFVRRVTENVHVSVFSKELDLTEDERNKTSLSQDHLTLSKGVEVFEIDGPFFFGVANKFEEQMRILGERSLVRVLRMRNVSFIDTTGIHNLEIFINSSIKDNIEVVLSGVSPEVHTALKNSGVASLINQDNICKDIHEAVALANKLAGIKGSMH